MPDAELLDELQARRAIKMPAFEARRGDDDVVELGEGGLEVRRIGIAVARPENPAVRQIAAAQVVYVIARLGEVADGDRFRGAGPAHEGPPSTPSAAPPGDHVPPCAASGGRIFVGLSVKFRSRGGWAGCLRASSVFGVQLRLGRTEFGETALMVG